jgi:hypothetical protein
VTRSFLISTSISVVGIFIVIAWDNLLPGLGDGFALEAVASFSVEFVEKRSRSRVSIV